MSSPSSLSFRSLAAVAFLGAAALAGLFATPPQSAAPAASTLGTVTFPNSGSPAAQPAFLRGIGALHSFWYEEARDAFREAQKIDPKFGLAYWGEAMTWNHTLWQVQDRDQANAVLARVPADAPLTAKERAYLDSLHILFGPGEKLLRDNAYAAAVEKIHLSDKSDDEATAFYALAILGTTRLADYGKGYARQTKAAALVLDLYARNPNHPGAAHYIIHSFDDPEHAILALPAARRYAAIAPEAHHAQHMPSHIFLQLALWDDAARSNESAWAASVKWVEQKNLYPSLRDFHSYHWLTYISLQQGRHQKAKELLDGLHATYRQYGPPGVRWNDDIAAAYVVETESWADAEALLAKPASLAGPNSAEYCGAAPTTREPRNGLNSTLFARAFSAAQRNAPEAEYASLWREVEAERPTEAGYRQRLWEINALQVRAARAAAQARTEEALTLAAQASQLEAQTSKPNGPPRLIKPSHELYGELLLRAGRPKEAAKEFETALSRQAGRALSLAGLARAQAQAGDRVAAASTYSRFVENWHAADPGLPALREARLFLEANAGLLAHR